MLMAPLHLKRRRRMLERTAEITGQPKPKRGPEATKPNEAPLPLRLVDAVKNGLRASWDRLGLVIALSLTWTLLLMGLFSADHLLASRTSFPARLAVLAALISLVLGPALAGACHVAYRAVTNQEATYFDFWQGAFRLYGQAARMALAQIVVAGVLTANFWFYARLGGLFGLMAALFCGYVALFWLTMTQFHYPLLVAQEAGVFDEPDHRARRGVWATQRRAFFLVLSRPFYAFSLLALTAPFTVACYVLMIPLLAAWLGVISLLLAHALRILLIALEVITPPVLEPVIPDEKFRISR